MTSVYIYNNRFEGPIGTCITGHIFLSPETNDADSQGIIRSAYIFNNTGIVDGEDSSGIFAVAGGSGHLIVNNTIVNTGSPAGACLSWGKISEQTPARTLTFKNNAISGCTNLHRSDMSGLDTDVTADYNAYANCSGGNCWYAFVPGAISTFSTYLANSYGQDQHAVADLVGTLGLNALTWVPEVGSMTIGAGVNLTASCTGALTALCLDKAGVARPSSGAWDIGAYQYASGATTPSVTASGPLRITGGVKTQ
jgi:hypothetical protein